MWFGGGRLAPDLSLPQLHARWDPDTAASRAAGPWASRPAGFSRGPDGELSELERRRRWVAAQQAVRRADEDLQQASSHLADPAAQASAQAAAASAVEVFGALSWLVERKRGGPLHDATDHYSRAARGQHRRTVRGTAHTRSARTAAGALAGARLVKRSDTRQLLSLLTQLTTLTESLARLREAQGRAAQAQAARRAAEQLARAHLLRAGPAAAPVAAAVAIVRVRVESAQHRLDNGPAARATSRSR